MDSLKPGVCPPDKNSGDPLKDIAKAMNAAEKELDPPVPKIIDPETMAHPENAANGPDERKSRRALCVRCLPE